MPKRKRGPISKAIKGLCQNLCLSGTSEAEFKQGLKRLIDEGAPYNAVAIALQKWAVEYCKDNIERVWKLADDVDARIREAGNTRTAG